MSYILDALRKADAERERGHVPGIHAQPAFGSPAPAPARAATARWGWIGAGAVIVVLLAALAWALLRGGPREGVAQAPTNAALPPTAGAPSPATPGTASTAATTPTGAAPTGMAQTGAAPAAPPATGTAVAVAPAAPTQPSTSPTAPVAAAQAPARPAPAPVARAPKPAAVTKPAPAAPAPVPAGPGSAETSVAQVPAAVPATSTANRVYAVNELPDDIRRALPVVTVGGSMYSSNAANRILIVNGQVLHEGERISPELVLQQIKVKAAVLAFRGYRYEIAF